MLFTLLFGIVMLLSICCGGVGILMLGYYLLYCRVFLISCDGIGVYLLSCCTLLFGGSYSAVTL